MGNVFQNDSLLYLEYGTGIFSAHFSAVLLIILMAMECCYVLQFSPQVSYFGISAIWSFRRALYELIGGRIGVFHVV